MRLTGFLVFLTGASALVHAMLYVWAVDAFPWVRARKRLLRRVLYGVVAVLPAVRAVTLVSQSSVAGAALALLTTELVVVFFASLPMIAVRGASRAIFRDRSGKLGRAAPAAPAAPGAQLADERATPPAHVTRRQLLEGGGGILALGTTGAVMGWGALRGRYEFGIQEVPVRIPGLPRALDGYTIGQVSDLHVGTFLSEHALRQGLGELARVKADMVVVTGDMVDFDPRYIPAMVRALGGIRARDGVYSILGNHDYYTGAAAVTAALRQGGVDVLVNQGRLVRPKDGGGFALLGVDDLWGAHTGGPGPRLDRALSAVPEDRPRVLLSHQPRSVDLWAGRVALQLSGHTHGGQINPGFRPADMLMKYVAGRYDVPSLGASSTTLYVNRGFGVAGPPVRVGAPPEITKIILVAA